MPGESPKFRFASPADSKKAQLCLNTTHMMRVSEGFAVKKLTAKLRKSAIFGLKRTNMNAILTSFTLITPFLITSANAANVSGPATIGLDQNSILLIAIFGGAVSFALLSAFWLIRERARISEDNLKLRQMFSTLRADKDGLAALIEAGDQRVIVWSGDDEKTKIYGNLPEQSGVPSDSGTFQAFGIWLTPESVIELEEKIISLKNDADIFTINVKTNTGQTIEVQGRVSGGHAFARFIHLEGAKEKLAQVTSEHNDLYKRFELIETLFQALPSPVWIRSSDGKLAYVNPAYADAVEAGNADQVIKSNKQLFDSKERIQIHSELETKHKHHGLLPVVVAGDRRKMETTSISTNNGSAGIATDRGDVDLVRATLKHTIASHEQTFDHLGSAVAIFDSKQRLQFHNSSFQQLWGFSVEDLQGNPSNGDLLEKLRDMKKLPETPDWKKWKEQQLSSYQFTETKEDHWHLPDGSTLRIIVNPQNQGGTSWVFENVTEELALKSNYNSLMRVQGETLDHLNEAVAVFGSDGKVKLTNPAFLSLWKFSDPQEIEGKHLNHISKNIRNTLKDTQPWQAIGLGITSVEDDREDLVGQLEMASGEILDYNLVYLPEGQSMLTFTNVTASVNVERALKERNDALEESDALKTRFIQHVSYELRAPLTSISGFAEILASNTPGQLNPKQAEYLDYISSSSDVLKSLIDDILDLATIDAGAMELVFGPVNIQTTINNAIRSLDEKLQRFQIKTEVKIENEVDGFIGDSDRIQQIVYNLISNAINVSPDGGKIKISSLRDKQNIILLVKDQGPGVPVDLQEKIFTRFEVGQNNERQRGAGLGLSIVRSFVELHGGSIHVESTEGSGATFVCQFPVKPSAQLEAAE